METGISESFLLVGKEKKNHLAISLFFQVILALGYIVIKTYQFIIIMSCRL